MSVIENLNNKAQIWYDQIGGLIAISTQLGKPNPDLSEYYKQLNKLFSEELELCKLIDSSDLIIHAVGPSAENHSLKLHTVTNLFEGIDTQIKILAKSVLMLGMDDVKPSMKYLDIRLNGLAPGSIYAGFSINPIKSNHLIATVEELNLIDSIRDVVVNLSKIPKFVNETGISEELSEILTDPAIRDSSLMAIYKIAPTGRQGIDSLALINPKELGSKPASLNHQDRSILRRSLHETPLIKSKSTHGTFIGQLRTVDLDKTRVDLRNLNVVGLDSLRCILPELTAEKGREILGKTVKVFGEYESALNGKPRLMHVQHIEVL